VADSPTVKRFTTGLLFLTLAAALATAGEHAPATVERIYSRSIYPALSAVLSWVSNAASFSLAELGLCAATILLVGRVLSMCRGGRTTGWRRAVVLCLADLTLAAGSLTLAFVLLWGLNYRRLPFAVSAGLDASPASVGELRDLALRLAQRANELRERSAEDGKGVMAVQGGWRSVLARTRAGFDAVTGRYPILGGSRVRPKPLLVSEALSWLGLTGIYSPFTSEANVNVNAPDSELPFSASHEASHQRGFAREDEANFAAYLACRFHPDPDFNYSGALAASIHASNALFAVDRAAWGAVEATRTPSVNRDLLALRAWSQAHTGVLSRASMRVNDTYLRAQGQRDGVRSYGRMVDLLLAERRAETRAQ
jgi:uncharacterized protein DUF3810